MKIVNVLLAILLTAIMLSGCLIFKKRFLNLYLLMYMAITAKNIRPIDPKANHIFNRPTFTLKPSFYLFL